MYIGIEWLNCMLQKDQVGLMRGLKDGRSPRTLLTPYKLLMMEFTSISAFINLTMTWEKTKEGHSYWQDRARFYAGFPIRPRTEIPLIGEKSGIVYLAQLSIDNQFSFLKNLTNVSRRPIAPYLIKEHNNYESFISGAFVFSDAPEDWPYWIDVSKNPIK